MVHMFVLPERLHNKYTLCPEKESLLYYIFFWTWCILLRNNEMVEKRAGKKQVNLSVLLPAGKPNNASDGEWKRGETSSGW